MLSVELGGRNMNMKGLLPNLARAIFTFVQYTYLHTSESMDMHVKLINHTRFGKTYADACFRISK